MGIMRSNARYNYRRSRRKDTQGKAGRIYEHLMAQALGCQITPHGRPELADIFSEEINARIEVKSRGDLNSFELRTKQIEGYKEDFPVPFDHTLYALLPWKASSRLRKDDPRPRGIGPNTHMISLLRGLKLDSERNEYWAANVETSYLFDLRIIDKLGTHLGVQPCRMIGRGDEGAIRIGRTTLNEMFGEDSSFSPMLRTLGFSPSGWAKGVYPLHVGFSIDGQQLFSRFTLVTILRKNLHAAIAQTLARQTLSLV
ncbi:MAG: hypothetical protein JWN89_304 [Parcubacteria group bacterium]|nr:hypothetical protein [Parcubacteria group bacterium]